MRKSVFLLLLMAAVALGTGWSAAAGAPPPNASTVLSVSPSNPVTLVPGNDVTIGTNTTGSIGQPYIDQGKVTIQVATDGGTPPLPVPAGSVTLWVDLAPNNVSPVAGLTSNDFDLDSLTPAAGGDPIVVLCGSTVGFRAHYVTGGGATHADTHFSPAVDVVTVCATCTGGLNIGATLASGDGCPLPPSSGPWTFRISVENCTGHDLTNVKVQGGTNGWAPMTGSVTSHQNSVTIRNNNRNQVLTWYVDIADGATETIDVTVDGNIKASTPSGTVLYLSGPWSAVYDDDGDPGTPPVKSDYTGRVSITVGPCGP